MTESGYLCMPVLWANNVIDSVTKIILIEDDEGFGRLVSKVCRRKEMLVDQALSTIDAFEKLGSNEYDIMILDYNLPDGSAESFLVKMGKGGLKIPFIVLTGQGDEEVAVAMMKAGAGDYLVKTNEVVKLLPDVVKKVLLENKLSMTQEALQRNERRLDALVNAPAGVAVLLSKSGEVLFLNRHAEELLGKKTDIFLGRLVADVFDGKTARDIEKNIETLKEDPHPIRWETERNGSIYQESLFPTFDDRGQLEDIAYYSRDATEDKEFEKRYLRLQRMESIGNLAGGLAHDFNNILAPIIISAEVLKSHFNKDQRALKSLDIILSSSERARNMVKQLLTFSRGDEGEKVSIQMSHLLREIKNISNQTFPKNIQLSFSISTQISPIMGDPTQLHQVFLNLLVNARDALPDGGHISVVAEIVCLEDIIVTQLCEIPKGEYLLISVQDDGIGICPETMDRIFEPFYTTKPQGKGTGLGLATSLGIIQAHQGYLVCSSESGVGTCFDVYLPITHEAKGFYTQENAPEICQGNGELIMVVDDEESVCNAAKTALETQGFEAICVADGIQAIPTFYENQKKIRAVLCDVEMPNMDGVVLMKTIRNIDPNIPIIVMSGFTGKGKIDSLRECNISLFIKKPFSIREMMETITSALHSDDRRLIDHVYRNGNRLQRL